MNQKNYYKIPSINLSYAIIEHKKYHQNQTAINIVYGVCDIKSSSSHNHSVSMNKILNEKIMYKKIRCGGDKVIVE